MADEAAEAARGTAMDRGRRPFSPRTARQYESDWATFRSWCRTGAMPALPATPASIATYLVERSATRGRSGLRVILAAIAHHHRQAGHPWASGHPAIGDALRRVSRKRNRPVRPAAALSSTELHRLVSDCGDDLAGLRDRALLLLGFVAALRRSELVALDHEDVRFTATGMVLHIRAPRAVANDRVGEIDLARGSDAALCAVRALEAWLRRAGIEYGAVFRRLTAAGTLEGRLTGNGVWKVLRRRAEAAGLVVAADRRLSPQALRAGSLADAPGRKEMAVKAKPSSKPKQARTGRATRRRRAVAASG